MAGEFDELLLLFTDGRSRYRRMARSPPGDRSSKKRAGIENLSWCPRMIDTFFSRVLRPGSSFNLCGGRAIDLGGRPIDALREKALSYCIPTQIQNLIPGHSGIFLLSNEYDLCGWHRPEGIAKEFFSRRHPSFQFDRSLRGGQDRTEKNR